MPDIRFTYTYTEIVTIFNTLGSEGLRAWSQVHLLDYVYPLGYLFALAFGMIMVLRMVYPDRTKLQKLIFLPIGSSIADYIENILIASQIATYPNLSKPVIIVVSLVTTLKWILIAICFSIIIVLFVVFIIKRVMKPVH